MKNILALSIIVMLMLSSSAFALMEGSVDTYNIGDSRGFTDTYNIAPQPGLDLYPEVAPYNPDTSAALNVLDPVQQSMAVASAGISQPQTYATPPGYAGYPYNLYAYPFTYYGGYYPYQYARYFAYGLLPNFQGCPGLNPNSVCISATVGTRGFYTSFRYYSFEGSDSLPTYRNAVSANLVSTVDVTLPATNTLYGNVYGTEQVVYHNPGPPSPKLGMYDY